MNPPKARERRAKAPVSTTKRAPEILAALPKIHEAQSFADIEVFFRGETEVRRIAPLAHLKVGAFIIAVRRVGRRNVGQASQHCFDARVHVTFAFLGAPDRILEGSDVGHPAACVFATRLGLANRPRGYVALRQQILELGLNGPPLRVQRQHARRLRRQTAAQHPGVEGIRVVANPLDIEHETAALRGLRAPGMR